MMIVKNHSLKHLLILLISCLALTAIIAGCSSWKDDEKDTLTGTEPVADAGSLTNVVVYSVADGTTPGTEPPEPIPTPTPAIPANALVSDSLRNGQTSGGIKSERGYQFTSEGVQFNGTFWYIRYQLSETLTSGYVQYKAKGFVPRDHHPDNTNHDGFKSRLVAMWNDMLPYGGYVPGMNLFELRKFGYIPGRPDADDTITFTIQTPEGGYQPDDTLDAQPSWDPNVMYTIRFEWGNGVMRFYRNDQLIREKGYIGTFAPTPHVVYIGYPYWVDRFWSSPTNLLISDVEIGRL